MYNNISIYNGVSYNSDSWKTFRSTEAYQNDSVITNGLRIRVNYDLRMVIVDIIMEMRCTNTFTLQCHLKNEFIDKIPLPSTAMEQNVVEQNYYNNGSKPIVIRFASDGSIWAKCMYNANVPDWFTTQFIYGY